MYKVNILNKKNKEVWRYYNDVNKAFKKRDESIKKALSSDVYVYILNKWHVLNKHSNPIEETPNFEYSELS